MSEVERTRGRIEGAMISLLAVGFVGVIGACGVGFFVLYACGAMTMGM